MKTEIRIAIGTLIFLAGMITMYLWLWSNGSIIPV